MLAIHFFYGVFGPRKVLPTPLGDGIDRRYGLMRVLHQGHGHKYKSTAPQHCLLNVTKEPSQSQGYIFSLAELFSCVSDCELLSLNWKAICSLFSIYSFKFKITRCSTKLHINWFYWVNMYIYKNSISCTKDGLFTNGTTTKKNPQHSFTFRFFICSGHILIKLFDLICFAFNERAPQWDALKKAFFSW